RPACPCWACAKTYWTPPSSPRCARPASASAAGPATTPRRLAACSTWKSMFSPPIGPISPSRRAPQKVSVPDGLLHASLIYIIFLPGNGVRQGRPMTISTQTSDLGALRAPLMSKLERLVDLSAPERSCLHDMQADFIKVRAGVDIITAGHSYRCVFVL